MKFKSLIIVVLAVVAMFAVGWISFSKTDTEANISIDTQEMKEDTDKAIEKGKQLIDQAKQAVDDATSGDDSDSVAPPLDSNDESEASGGTSESGTERRAQDNR